MHVEFVSGTTIEQTVTRFIAEYDELYWAVAWGTFARHAQVLLDHAEKFRAVTFGVAFSQTDPDLIDALIGVKCAYVATRFAGGTYHPKVYCFRSEAKAAAIVGSPNFTSGGLGNNLEAAVVITGDAREPVFEDLLRFIRSCAEYGEAVTRDFATAYRASHRRASRLPRPPRDPVPDLDTRTGENPPLLASMTWQQFSREARSSAHHDFDGSLELLRIAQEWFASVRSFMELDAPRRKAIAGTLGNYQKRNAQLDRDWGWFGSMKGMGDFANRIDRNDEFLARAIDSIPRQGEVTKLHYERFAGNFIRAFEHSDRTGGVPTATRLLAMKRPDTFLCVCGPNIMQASHAIGFARTALTLDNYWDRVVEVIRLSDWYHTERPTDDDAELWDCRVAMLDAIFYRP